MTTTHFLRSHCRLLTHDLDEARQWVSGAWEKIDVELRRGRYRLRWHQAGLGGGDLGYLAHPCALDLSCGPVSNVFRLYMHEQGRATHQCNGRSTESTPETGVLHAPGQAVRLQAEPVRLLFLGLDGGLVRPALDRRFGRLPPFEDWALAFPMASPAASSLRSLCRWTATELDRPDTVLLSSPKAMANLRRTMLAIFLDCLAERLSDCNDKTGDLDEQQVRLIEMWMEANLGDPIGLEEMAAALNVSVGAVNSAFRRLRRCTPMQALSRLRLEAARRLLLQPAPDATVTTTAIDCGCFHLGRFSVRYRALFGESPSATLARSRGGRNADRHCPRLHDARPRGRG